MTKMWFSNNYDESAHREEEFRFQFDIKDKDVFTAEEKARIAELMSSNADMLDRLQSGDTFSFTYRVFISYFGQVARKLETMLMVMDKCHNFEVSTSELNHGKCLIQEVFCRIEEIERKYGH